VAQLRSRYFLDIGGGPEDCVLLAGSGRSGTTWVGDVLNYRNGYRTLFEPFWKKKVPMVAHFRARQYLAPGCTDPAFVEPAARILSGRVRNAFVDSLNTKWIARKRLVKDIRINLMLGWIHARFPATPIVLLLRHPCAVAVSAMKLGWIPPLDDVMQQQDLVAAHLERWRESIERIRADGSEFDQRILLWCIENAVALAQLAPDARCVVHYENFCREDPRPEIARMFAHVGMPFDDTVLEAMRRPSKLSAADSAVLTGSNLVDSWRAQVTTAQIDRAVEILALFGLDAVYGADSRPCTVDG
jgi:hypothetical protein